MTYLAQIFNRKIFNHKCNDYYEFLTQKSLHQKMFISKKILNPKTVWPKTFFNPKGV